MGASKYIKARKEGQQSCAAIQSLPALSTADGQPHPLTALLFTLCEQHQLSAGQALGLTPSSAPVPFVLLTLRQALTELPSPDFTPRVLGL